MKSSLFSSLVALFLVACAGSASPTTFIAAAEPTDAGPGDAAPKKDAAPSKPKAVTAAEACASFAKERCSKEKTCSSFAFAATWGDEPTCEARLVLGCADKLSEPGVTWKPDGLAECASALSSASCDDLALGIVPPECTPSPGTLDAKEACAHDEQCSTGHCKKGSFGGCGSCAELGKENAYCQRGTDCAPGLSCSGGSCRVPQGENDFCGTSRPCGPGLVCSGNYCRKGAPVGSSCGDSPSAPDPCDQANGVVCSPLLMSCVAANVVAIGDSCNPYSDLCAAGGRCSGFGSSAQCEPPPDEGDACTVTGNAPGCFWPTVCDLGKCIVPTAAACAK